MVEQVVENNFLCLEMSLQQCWGSEEQRNSERYLNRLPVIVYLTSLLQLIECYEEGKQGLEKTRKEAIFV